MKSKIILSIVTLMMIGVVYARSYITEVAVIAPSVSTSMKAREICRSMHWSETSPKKADFVLVVVRSSLYNPLSYSYNCYCKLRDDADSQLNISGPTYHVYVYSLNDDLSVGQLKHVTFDADDR